LPNRPNYNAEVPHSDDLTYRCAARIRAFVVDDTSELSLGHVIREARVHARLSLRELAKRVSKTPSYLSDIENDRRVPSEEVLRRIGQVLGLQFDDMMARAGRLGEQTLRYLRQHPLAGVLFRHLAKLNASEADLRDLLKRIEDLSKSGRE
jgi:transcriptional regulator with XRE-family HTH domain